MTAEEHHEEMVNGKRTCILWNKKHNVTCDEQLKKGKEKGPKLKKERPKAKRTVNFNIQLNKNKLTDFNFA